MISYLFTFVDDEEDDSEFVVDKAAFLYSSIDVMRGIILFNG